MSLSPTVKQTGNEWGCQLIQQLTQKMKIAGTTISVFFVNVDENDNENNENILSYRRRD